MQRGIDDGQILSQECVAAEERCVLANRAAIDEHCREVSERAGSHPTLVATLSAQKEIYRNQERFARGQRL